MDKRFFFILFAVVGSILVLFSCSQVFEAGISGKVVTEVGTDSVAVSDVNVFAYTDKGARDSDYEEFKAGTRTRPSEKAGYVAATTTNANGEFVVNKIVWETKKSRYGKTADVNKLYLIFYHEDYEVAAEDATVISDSTNQSNVYVTLRGNKDYTTLNVRINNIATGTLMTDSCTLKYKVEGKEESDSVIVTGAASIRISFLKSTTPDVTFTLTSPGSGWAMCDYTGALIENQIEENVDSGTLEVSLYMKSYVLTLPGFSGSAKYGSEALFDDKASNDNDGILVWLEYQPAAGGSYVPFTETVNVGYRTESEQASGTTLTPYFNHGLFSGIGNSGYSIEISSSSYSDAIDWDAYATSKNAVLKLRLAFSDGAETPTVKYYTFSHTFPTGSTSFNNIVPTAAP